MSLRTYGTLRTYDSLNTFRTCSTEPAYRPAFTGFTKKVEGDRPDLEVRPMELYKQPKPYPTDSAAFNALRGMRTTKAGLYRPSFYPSKMISRVQYLSNGIQTEQSLQPRLRSLATDSSILTKKITVRVPDPQDKQWLDAKELLITRLRQRNPQITQDEIDNEIFARPPLNRQQNTILKHTTFRDLMTDRQIPDKKRAVEEYIRAHRSISEANRIALENLLRDGVGALQNTLNDNTQLLREDVDRVAGISRRGPIVPPGKMNKFYEFMYKLILKKGQTTPVERDMMRRALTSISSEELDLLYSVFLRTQVRGAKNKDLDPSQGRIDEEIARLRVEDGMNYKRLQGTVQTILQNLA